jgi:hypothetical protein
MYTPGVHARVHVEVFWFGAGSFYRLQKKKKKKNRI